MFTILVILWVVWVLGDVVMGFGVRPLGQAVSDEDDLVWQISQSLYYSLTKKTRLRIFWEHFMEFFAIVFVLCYLWHWGQSNVVYSPEISWPVPVFVAAETDNGDVIESYIFPVDCSDRDCYYIPWSVEAYGEVSFDRAREERAYYRVKAHVCDYELYASSYGAGGNHVEASHRGLRQNVVIGIQTEVEDITKEEIEDRVRNRFSEMSESNGFCPELEFFWES